MPDHRPRAISARHAFFAASLLIILALNGVAPPAHAAPTRERAPGLGAWPSDTGTAPDDDRTDGGRAALSQSPSGGLLEVPPGPAWSRRVTVDLNDPDHPQAHLAAPQSLPRIWGRSNRFSLRGGFSHDPGGSSGGGLGLYYRPSGLDDDLTLAVSGTLETHGLQDSQHHGIGTQLRLDAFELGTSRFDAAPGLRSAASGVPERRVDGYGIALGARLPELPWGRFRVKRQWQIPIDARQPTTSDRVSLQLGPLAPLEIETGTTSAGERRSWFAQLRVRIPFGQGG